MHKLALFFASLNNSSDSSLRCAPFRMTYKDVKNEGGFYGSPKYSKIKATCLEVYMR